ncbi:uncharacterized protein VTP21DRAFT_8538 [Calcarisporiella thermophila]|uniref:uncharacterized protein n=1 Tax=Calcarisporiella thermophila TaxID=911321 RepID=UPI0037448098
MNLSPEHTVAPQQYFAHVQYGGYAHSRMEEQYISEVVKSEYGIEHPLLEHMYTSAYNLSPSAFAGSPTPSSLHSVPPDSPHAEPLSQPSSKSQCEQSHPQEIVVSQVPSTPRYVVCLDARTAITRVDECPLTYLNKMQHYSLFLNSNEYFTEDITCTIRLMFHDAKDQAKHATLWKYWLKLQKGNPNPRVIEIDRASALNVKNFVQTGFDRVQFQWNAQHGARMQLRFNCLSTDFSMIKGIKGIPLRIHVENRVEGAPHTVESGYCRVKLFRDKGAERKYKDDLNQIKKQMAKMKEADAACPIASYLGEQQTFFSVYPRDECDVPEDDAPLDLAKLTRTLESESDSDSDSSNDQAPALPATRRRQRSPSEEEPLDYDPDYVPPTRAKRRRLLCLLIRGMHDTQHRAIYLNQLTLEDLISKIAEKMSFEASQVGEVLRYTSRGMVVRVDDGMISQMEEETPIMVELVHPSDGDVAPQNCTLALHF